MGWDGHGCMAVLSPSLVEFRPQLLHEKLASATTGASKTEMLFTLVKNLDGFRDMSREALWQTVTSAGYESFSNGQVIYSTSDKVADIFVILSGGVKVVMDGSSIAFLSDRDVFGHVEVALHHSRRLCSVVASEATKAVRIPRQLYLTMWPHAAQHKEDVQFLQNLPGMGKMTPKAIMSLYYNVNIRSYQVRGTVVFSFHYCIRQC